MFSTNRPSLRDFALALGMALVFPGKHSRLSNLAIIGRKVAPIIVGSVALFFIAALIEGYFRQLVQSEFLRWSMAGGTLVLWTVYFVFLGRRSEDPEAAGG